MAEGLPHPDPIVESQTLASVIPPDITYKHHLQVCYHMYPLDWLAQLTCDMQLSVCRAAYQAYTIQLYMLRNM